MLVVCPSGSDGVIKIWDLREGRLLYSLRSHKSTEESLVGRSQGRIRPQKGGGEAFSPAINAVREGRRESQSELCSGNCAIVKDLASVRADSSVVSWLNVTVTHQIQDTSLGSNLSPQKRYRRFPSGEKYRPRWRKPVVRNATCFKSNTVREGREGGSGLRRLKYYLNIKARS